MEYEAEIQFSDDGTWLKGGSMDRTQFEFTKQRYGNSALARLGAGLDGPVSISAGQREKFTGKLQFQKTERGWKGEDGNFY